MLPSTKVQIEIAQALLRSCGFNYRRIAELGRMSSASIGREFSMLEHILLYTCIDASASKGHSEIVYRREILRCDGP